MLSKKMTTRTPKKSESLKCLKLTKSLHPLNVGECSRQLSSKVCLNRKSCSASSSSKIHGNKINSDASYYFTLQNKKFNSVLKGNKNKRKETKVYKDDVKKKWKLPKVNDDSKPAENDVDDMCHQPALKNSKQIKDQLSTFDVNKYSQTNVKERINLKFLHLCNDRKKILTKTSNIIASSNLCKSLIINQSNYIADCGEESKKKDVNYTILSPRIRKKIYYSERQLEIKNGVPSVPPCSPEMIEYDYVGSMADLKSQRHIIKKLHCLESRQMEKERELCKKARQREEKRKAEELQTLIKKQRRQIYFLNEIMTKYENDRYLEFIQDRSGAPV